ncbi:MAG: D-alanine--D-alanine ligase [Rickettsiaceae bacterium]
MQKFNTIFIAQSKIVDCTMKHNSHLLEYTKSCGSDIDSFALDKCDDKNYVLVIGGGMSAEREVSYMSSDGIINSLLELGYFVIFADMGADIAKVLHQLKPDVVFNALHGTYGEDGCLPGLLNILRIPHTGPGVLASALAFNKKKSHHIFKATGIEIAHSIIVNKSDNIKQDPLPRPYVIKPISQGSSVGVEVIFTEDNFSFEEYNFEYGDQVIIEKYIKGREIQVAVLNGKAKGALEIQLLKNKRFYDYETKYTDGFARHLMPAPMSLSSYNNALHIAEEVCQIFECESGLIRVEFIYNEQEDKLYLIELNTHPGMTSLSICPEIIEYSGISYTELVKLIIQDAKFE